MGFFSQTKITDSGECWIHHPTMTATNNILSLNKQFRFVSLLSLLGLDFHITRNEYGNILRIDGRSEAENLDYKFSSFGVKPFWF